MKVFISWSGNDSKQVAELLSKWIPDVLQDVELIRATGPIDKGALWMNDIGDKLKEISVGILCLTKSNIDAPWILFEAGALSKGLTKSRVCPLLIDLSHKDLKPPLANFNATTPTQEDMLKLIKTINAQAVEKKLTDERVERAFVRCWSEFEKSFAAIVKGFKLTKAVVQPTVQEMVTEILELARSIQANAQQERAAKAFSWLKQPESHSQDLSNTDLLKLATWLTAQSTAKPLGDAFVDSLKEKAKVLPYVQLPIQTGTSSSD